MAQLATLVDRNDKFEVSMNRAMYAHMLINETEASRDIAYVKRRRILQETKFTVEQLKEIRSDESKMLGMPVMDESTAVVEPKASAVDYTDLRGLMCSINDDLESVTSEATQRTVVGIGGVLKTTEDYVEHAAALQNYSGDRLKKAEVRYPADAQRAFDRHAGALVLHYDRDLSHSKALHAYNTDLRECKAKFAMTTDFVAYADAKNRLADKYQAVKKGKRQYDADVEQLAEKALKSSNTALLAQALQPAWQARSGSAYNAALQSHGPPSGYEDQSTVFSGSTCTAWRFGWRRSRPKLPCQGLETALSVF